MILNKENNLSKSLKQESIKTDPLKFSSESLMAGMQSINNLNSNNANIKPFKFSNHNFKYWVEHDQSIATSSNKQTLPKIFSFSNKFKNKESSDN